MEIRMKRVLCAIAVIAVSATVFLPTEAMARPDREIVIVNPPPPLRHERVPGARHGHMWIPGYWNWNGRRHVWIGGHWERERAGYRYRNHEWRQGDRGWYLHRGGWER